MTGGSIRALHDEAIRRPLGFRWMRYGVERADLPLVAHQLLHRLPGAAADVDDPAPHARRRLRARDRARRTIRASSAASCPAASMVATADELCRFYELLLARRRRSTAPGSSTRARCGARPASRATWSSTSRSDSRSATACGFMLGGDYLSFYGPDTSHAFGHLGLTNVVAWADPEREVSCRAHDERQAALPPGAVLDVGDVSPDRPGVSQAPSRWAADRRNGVSAAVRLSAGDRRGRARSERGSRGRPTPRYRRSPSCGRTRRASSE